MMSTDSFVPVCHVSELIAGGGIAVKIDQQQVALFYLPEEEPAIYALDSYDPIGRANVLSRGIVGDRKGELVVASPLYKQHFSLTTGVCIEDEAESVRSFSAKILEDQVVVQL